jgi:superfamily II DNA or RNA helicase
MAEGNAGVFHKDYGWQERAVGELMAGLPEFYSKEPGQFQRAFIAEVSPSGGKTRFSLKAAKAMIDAKLIDKVFFIAPRETIKDGFKADAADVGLRIDTNLDANYTGMLRNFDGAVVLYQSLDRFQIYLELARARGLKIMLVLDEIHHGRAGTPEDATDDACGATWGHAMEAARAHVCVIIGMTGTPVRADQQEIAFLRYETARQLNPQTGAQGLAKFVAADFKFSYKMAIECGVARKLIFRPQDPHVVFRYDKDGQDIEYTGPLSGVPRLLTNRVKRILVSPDRGHIDDMLHIAREENDLDRRIGDEDAAILVIVGPTEDNGHNPLGHVASRIRRLFAGDDVVAVESSDGPAAAEAVKEFKHTAVRWLVAKDMVSEGTNVPRVRTVLILRDIQSHVRFQQIVHRATRNRSDEFPQDAKVVFFHLPEMVAFAGTIEEEIKLVVPKPKSQCPQCAGVLEYRPRTGHPCSHCGYEPDPRSAAQRNVSAFDWLFSKLGCETVLQGGDDYSNVDPVTRQVLGKLGENPHYGGRHGLNEALKTAHDAGLISLQESGHAQPLFSKEEMGDRYWEAGRKNCEKAAGLISRKNGTNYQETLRNLTAQCKRVAGMGGDKKDTVQRDYKDPLGTFKKFYEASRLALENARKRFAA